LRVDCETSEILCNLQLRYLWSMVKQIVNLLHRSDTDSEGK